jgi:four helix bundle protein
MQLVQETYRITAKFPGREMYGLASRMCGAAVSIAANIAEGQARRATKDYLRFLAVANGSLRELETYCDMSAALQYFAEADLTARQRLMTETGRMLMGLRQALKGKLGKKSGLRIEGLRIQD